MDLSQSLGGPVSIALPIAFSAAIIFAVGNILQKSAMNRESHCAPSGVMGWAKRLLRSPFWLLGIGCSCLGVLLQYYSMARWNISFVQPLIGMNPVLTAFLGWIVLKERTVRGIWGALFFVAVGLILMGMVGEEAPGKVASGFWWLTAAGVIAMLFFHLNRRISGEIRYALASGIGFGLSVVLYKVIVTSLGGVLILGWQEVLKALLFSPVVWCYIAVYIASFFLSQAALAQGRAMVVVPLSSVIGSSLPVAAGLLLFQEPLSLFKGAGLLAFLFAFLLFLPQGSEKRGAE